MIGRGRIFVLGACLALATVSLSTPMHAYAAPVASQVGSNIGVISDVPLAETATESEVEQPAKVPSTTIQPDTVASGYRLVSALYPSRNRAKFRVLRTVPTQDRLP